MQRNPYFQTRSKRLFIIHIKEYIISRHYEKGLYRNLLNTEYLLFLKEKEELMFIVTPSINSHILQFENLFILLLALTYFLNIFITLK